MTVEAGQTLTIDGSDGRVLLGAIPTLPPAIFPEFKELLAWADEKARLKVRTNADNPPDARNAVEFGAMGIGLLRAEHMFLNPKSRVTTVQEMLLSATDAKRLEAEPDAPRDRAGVEARSASSSRRG